MWDFIYLPMPFTDRFITLPIKVYDQKTADVVGKPDYEDSIIKIVPFEISDYKPTSDADHQNCDCVYVMLKNGRGFFVYLSMKQFEKLLNEHAK